MTEKLVVRQRQPEPALRQGASAEDFSDLLASTRCAILWLDARLCVRHFTPACGDLLALEPEPWELPLAELRWRFDASALLEDARRALMETRASDDVVHTDSGSWYLRRVTPFRPVDGRAEGVVVNFIDITAEREAELALRERERTLSGIIDAVPVLISYVDRDCRYQFNNAAYETWFGVRRDDLRGRHLSEVLGEASYGIIRPYVETVLRNEPVSFEGFLPYRHGGTRYVRVDYMPDMDEAGAIRGFYALITDLTERRRIVDEIERLNRGLRRQLRETQAILEAAPIGIYVAQDAQCRQMTMNAVGAAMLHLHPGANPSPSAAATEDLPFRIFRGGRPVAPEDLPMQRAAAQDRTLHAEELQVVYPDGSSVTVVGHAAPLHDEQGCVCGCVGTFVDVTDMRRAEADLQEARRRLDLHMENTPLALIEWDAQLRLTRWQAAAEPIFGWTEAEVAGKRLDELRFLFGDETEAIRAHGDALHSGRVERSTATHRNFRKDGTALLCKWYSSALRGPTGELVSVLSLVLDVTEQERLDQELREQARQLAEADRRKNEFLATLGHELRNPLAPIRNAVTTLSLGERSTRSVDHAVSVISRQAHHLVRLADDLLDVARISRGTIELHRGPVELARVVDDTLEATRGLVTRKQHQLDVQLPDDPIVLNGDATRLTQIVTNLINNAAKYTPEGGHIALRAWPEGHMLGLEVSDDGVGIDPADLPRLFETFGQSKRSLGQAEGGLGLGLALVRKLVELHEGTIEAHSEGPGRGARFTLRLPMMTTEAAMQPGPQPAADTAPAEAASKRILIVDDQRDVADSFELLIGALGHTVQCVYDGEQALDAAREFHPEVVLLDLSLPGMDGYEVARRLCASPDRERMRLIAMSGFGTEEIAERVRQAGFDDYLLKPIDLERLDDLLRRC